MVTEPVVHPEEVTHGVFAGALGELDPQDRF